MFVMPHASHESAIQIPLSNLIEFRSRTVYKNLDELAKSLAEHGQIEPLIVRLSSKTSGVEQYEIAAGTRRKRAAAINGLASLSCIVRDLSDQQMIEVTIAENRDREDIHPLDEADGFTELHDTFGMTIGELGARFGRSEDYVYGRLKIASMHFDLRTAFLANRFGVKGALVLAGVATSMQPRVWVELSKLPDATLSASKITQFVRDRFLLRLASAPFPTDDAKLCKEVGSCSRCPKRTGAQSSLFPEDLGANDRCVDADCFTAKKQAFAEVLIERATKKSLRVLEKSEAREVFKFGESVETLNPDCSFVAVDGKVRLGEEGMSYREILKGGPPPIVVAINPGGAGLELYEKAAVAKAMRTLKVPFVREWESVCLPKMGEKPSSDKKQDRGEAKLERRAAELAIDELRLAVETAAEKMGSSPKQKKIFQLVALGAARNTWSQVQKAYIKKHKLDDGKTGGDANARILAMLEDHISKLTEAQCCGFVFEIALLREVFGAAGGPDVKAELFDRGLAVTGLKYTAFRKGVEKAQEGTKGAPSEGKKAEPTPRAGRSRTSPKKSDKPASDEGEEGSGAGGCCAVCGCTRSEPCSRERGECTRERNADLCSHCEDILAVVKSVVEEKSNPFQLNEIVEIVKGQDLAEDTDADKSVVQACLSMLEEQDKIRLFHDGRYQTIAV